MSVHHNNQHKIFNFHLLPSPPHTALYCYAHNILLFRIAFTLVTLIFFLLLHLAIILVFSLSLMAALILVEVALVDAALVDP